ncbi:MAG: flippase activity-associated protein Agl23 [bacterium]
MKTYHYWILAIFAVGILLRLLMLDTMAFHHDESIHAMHSHYVYRGDLELYKYDPTYHGPFLYHYVGLFFLIFGDTDYTARMPFALFGILMMYFVWRLRPWLGNAGTLTALLLVALSPTLTYFARFARNDVFMGAFALGILLYGLEYLRHRRGWDLVKMTFWLALMYATKENSLMTGFSLGSFAVFYGIYYYFSYPKEARNQALREIFVERGPFVKILALYAIFTATMFSLVGFVSLHFDEAVKTSHSIATLRVAWNQYLQQNAWVIPFWVAAALLTVVVVFTVIGWIQRRVTSEETEESFFSRVARNNVWVLVCCLVFFTIYSILFTTLGTNPAGMKAGVVDYLLYWMGQQGEPRIPGPPDYFVLRLLIYEIAAVILGALAFFIYTYRSLHLVKFTAFLVAFSGTVYVYWKTVLVDQWTLSWGVLVWLIFILLAFIILFFDKLARLFSFVPETEEGQEERDAEETESPLYPDGVRVFLIYWTVTSVLVYAMLQEKVPWLLVHQALPLALLAGVFAGDLWRRFHPRRRVLVYACAGILGIFALYELKSTINVVFYYPDNPQELLVYVQTGPELFGVLDEIKTGAARLGREYTKSVPRSQQKFLVAIHGDATWPYVWYLRDYNTFTIDENFTVQPPAGVPFALVDDEYQDRMKVWGKGQYIKRKVLHRLWWPPLITGDLKESSFARELPFSYYRKRNLPVSDAWKALWNYLMYRHIWNREDPNLLPSAELTMFYTKEQLIEPEAKPEVAQGYELPPRPLNVVNVVGSLGGGQGEFNQPRGVALSPDQQKVYILDSINGRIQVFTRDFEFISMIGGPGTGIGQFNVSSVGNGPNGGIDVGPDGTIYATDTWADGGGRINRYTPEGEPLSPLYPPGGFYFPRGLTVAPDGSLFVADTGHHSIVKFNADGSYAGPVVQGALNEPVGLAIGPNDMNVYVCDVANQRVAAFTQEGRLVRSFSILGWNAKESGTVPWIEPYVAVSEDGFVYITDSTNGMIHCFNPTGTNVIQYGGSANQGALNKPKGITVDREGYLYIADSFNHRVVKAQILR